jgi:hypothetical protein
VTDRIRVPRAIWLRVALWLGVAGLLALGFAGYLHPDMRLDWAAIAQLCGLR